jgi:hypothetical protein
MTLTRASIAVTRIAPAAIQVITWLMEFRLMVKFARQLNVHVPTVPQNHLATDVLTLTIRLVQTIVRIVPRAMALRPLVVDPHALSVPPMNMQMPAPTPVPPKNLYAQMVTNTLLPLPAAPIQGLLMALKIVRHAPLTIT